MNMILFHKDTFNEIESKYLWVCNNHMYVFKNKYFSKISYKTDETIIIMKYTLVPLLTAMSLAACSQPQLQTSNYNMCYQETQDSIYCKQQYPASYEEAYNTRTVSNQDNGLSGLEVAAIGAAAGAAGGALTNKAMNRSKTKRDDATAVVVPPSTRSESSRNTTTSSTPSKKSSVNLSKTAPKSSSRGGWGSSSRSSGG